MAGKTESKENKGAKPRTRWGQVRCLNCFERVEVPPRAERITCPSCNWEWRISWVNPKLPKVRGPMWEEMSSTHRR